MTNYIKQEETNNALAAILKGDDPANLWNETDFIAIQSEEDKDATGTAWIDQGKRCAIARNVSWSALQRAYSIWKKRGLVRLTACKTVQDFEAARAFLTACEAENVTPPFTLAMVIDAEKAAGITLDPETSRRLGLLEKQEKTWNTIAEIMCGGWGVTLSASGYMGLKPSKATPKPTYFLARDIIYLGKARDYSDGSWNYVFEFRDGSGVWKTKLIPAKLFGVGRGNEWLSELKRRARSSVTRVCLPRLSTRRMRLR